MRNETPQATSFTSKRAHHPWLATYVCVYLVGWGSACHTQNPMGSGEAGSGRSSDSNDETGMAGTTTGSAPELERRDVLASIASNVIVPAIAAFSSDADGLEQAVSAHVAALTNGGDDPTTTLVSAQQSWHTAMAQWQRLEVMQVGPAASSLDAIAGENRRDAIYSWPTVNTCAIDRALADETFLGPDFLSESAVYVFGLDALEYLLFMREPGHTCPPQIQLEGPWTALGLAEVERRRAEYAQVLAQEISRQAHALEDRWAPSKDDFAGLLAKPGVGDSPYPDDREALDQVFRAMFYVDLVTKDAKLGRALGLQEGCISVPCPDLLELPWSGDAALALAANLEALRDLVIGGQNRDSAHGFDDLLEQDGHGEIANTLLGDIDAAIDVCRAFDKPLQGVLASDTGLAQVRDLYDAIKRVTDTLKNSFVLALMLTVPSDGDGDND